MFTVCPKCSLKLVVTAADLRVAQGYVRCGRCTNVFNALAALSDESQGEPASEQDSTASPPLEPPAPPSSDPQTASSASAAARQPEAAFEFDPISTDVSEIFIEARADDPSLTGQSQTIVLRSEAEPGQPSEVPEAAPQEPPAAPDTLAQDGADDPDEVDHGPPAEPAEASEADAVERSVGEHSLEETDEFELADLQPLLASKTTHEVAGEGEPVAVPSEAQAPSESAAPDGGPGGALTDATASTMPVPAPAQPAAESGPSPHEDAGEADASTALATLAELAPATTRLQARWPFALATVGLALLLAAQIVNHYRARLVEVPWLKRPLTTAYAAVGHPLVPHWNVTAYTVRQLGAIVRPGSPGTLMVRASIENTARRAQPLPLLRVIVQDRFGNRVAARDVRPTAYLPQAPAQPRWLGAGQRVDAEVAFVDPGPRAVGFVLDACLAVASGRITCAHPARAPATGEP